MIGTLPAVGLLALIGLAWGQGQTRVVRLTARFSYDRAEAPQSCPTRGQMRHEIESGLGYGPFQPDAPLRLAITILRPGGEGDELIAEVTLSDEHGALLGQQRIHGSNGDCRTLASAAALAARLVLEPEGESAPKTTPIASDLRADPIPVVPPASVSRTETSTTLRPPAVPRLVISLGPLVAVGASASPNWGLMGGAELRWIQVSLGLELRADFPSTTALSVDNAASQQTSLLGGLLVPCARFNSLSACGLLMLGREQSRGVGLNPNLTLDTLYAAAGARLGYELHLSRLVGLAAFGDLLVPFSRTQLFVSGERAWITPPLSASLWLALETGIP